MTTRNETFNGIREFPIAGAYFELLSTVNPVDLKFFDAKGDVISDERQVSAGQWVDRRGNGPDGKPLTHFVRFEITTGASEAVKFTATDGTSGSRVAPTAITSNVQPLGLSHIQAKVAVTNASGTLLAANATRRFVSVQNPSAAGNIWIRTDGAAAVADATCFKVEPGQVWEPIVPPLAAIKAIGDLATVDIQVIEA